MKKVLLSLFLLGASLGTRAQQHYLDLSRQRLDVPERTVAIDQIVDGRRDNSPIGYVYRGLSNSRPLTMTFRYGAGVELTNLVHAQLPARPTDYRVALCLRQLLISEQRLLGIEQGEAYMSVDAYIHRPDGYHFIKSIGSHTAGLKSDVTRLHAGHVAQLLSYTISQLSTQADWETALAQPARTLAQLPTDAPVALPSRAEREPLAPILREVPRRGIYRSFAQFLANRPDTTQVFRLDTVALSVRGYLAWQRWQRVPWVQPLAATAQGSWEVPADAWGFSDGQNLFVRQEEHFFPLLRQGRFFTTVGTAAPDRTFASALEAAERGAYTAETIISSPNMPNLTDTPTGYAVDMRSGALSPYPGLYAPARPDTAYVYVYRPARAAGPNQVQVWLNGKQAGALRPGQYMELPWSHFATLLNLCLIDASQGSACQYVIPDTKRPNFLRITFSPEAPLWQWVTPEQGLADLDALDKQRR